MDEQERNDQQKEHDRSNFYAELERATRVDQLVKVATGVLYRCYFDGKFASIGATFQDIELIVYYMFSSAQISLKVARDNFSEGSGVHERVDENDHT